MKNNTDNGKPRREFIFASYSKSHLADVDILAVKEHLHYPDGEIKPNLRIVKDYQRKFYITKPEFRDHEQKKELESLSKLDEYTTTQIQMPKLIAKVLKMFGRNDMRSVSESPYLYGSDVTTPVLIGQDYRRIEPELNSDATLAIMDYETDVINDTKLIISGSVTFKDKAVVATTFDFLGMRDRSPEAIALKKASILATCRKYLDDLTVRNINLEIEIVENAGQVVCELYKRCHQWKPDILGFWNIAFDIPKVIEALSKYGYDPARVFSDPAVPPEFKYFNWREDSKIKTTADGKQISKHIADLWHTVNTPASFYHIDLMCLFKRVRVREQQRNSYSLDAILESELDITKLKFKEADGLTRLAWHECMQSKHKEEYLAYNIFDCISVERLDEKTGDVAKSLRPLVDISEMSKAASNPKRLADNFHFILEKRGDIIGSVSADLTEDLDRFTPKKSDWIITLAAELQYKIGRRLINEYPELETNIATHAEDIDVKSAYPTAGSIMNISKGTSRVEVCSMDGVPEMTRRSVGINLTAPKTNALEIANIAYGLATPQEFLEAFKRVI